MSFSKMVPIQLGGKTRNLKYDFNAFADIEDALKMSIQGLMQSLVSGAGIREIRALVWAGMRHETPSITLPDVGDMLQEVYMNNPDDFKALGAALREALESAFPQVEKRGKVTPKVPGKN